MAADSGTFMWMALVPTRRKYGLPPVIVPKSVIDELDSLASERSIRSKRSRDASALLRSLIDSGDAECFGEENDGSFADNVFVSILTRYRLRYRLILVTQDRKLAKDVLLLNRSNSIVRIHGIDAFRVGDQGYPERWILNSNDPHGVASKPAVPIDGFALQPPLDELSHRPATPIHRIRALPPPTRRRVGVSTSPRWAAAFNLRQARPFSSVDEVMLAKMDDTPIETTSIPVIGSTISDTDGRSFRLIEEIGKGGEGTVYAINQDLACKVYHHDRIFNYVIKKLRLMTTRKVSHPAICWPRSLAYNSDRRIIGYLMAKATGKELRRTVFIPPLLRERFPHWTRLHLVQLASKILEAVKFLHDMNVLLGDINPANIIVQSENSFFLVDCDSYQVEGYPCPVGMPTFLSPDLIGRDLRSTLRNINQENFAIATLIFMILHPGKPPYSHKGGEDPLTNVKNFHFPYQRGDQRSIDAPDGPWRYMFSHLTRKMKDAFHSVFSDSKSLTVLEWLQLLSEYEHALKNGYVSANPFPKDFKKLSEEQTRQAGGEWRVCVVCGDGFGAFKSEHTMCRSCARSRLRPRGTF